MEETDHGVPAIRAQMCYTRESERSCHRNTHPQRNGPAGVRETRSTREVEESKRKRV